MVTVHPTAIIEDGAQLGEGCVVHAYAIVTRHAVLGNGVIVHPFAVVGGDPQDLRFDASLATGVRIGERTVIREHVTIHRATKPGGWTEVGAHCYLMVGCHIAHDCRLADRVIVANDVLFAGHIHVGEGVFIGGGAVMHQFSRIGDGAMVGGASRVSQDVPPFSMVTERDRIVGLNVVGLRRRGLPRATVEELKKAFREVNVPVGNMREIAGAALARGEYTSDEARRYLEFFGAGKRGIARARRDGGDRETED